METAMKLCIPIKQNNGLDSHAYSHFGSAPAFILFDTGTDEYEIIDNSNMHHSHGACMPMESLIGKNVDAVLVGGIGERAISKLNNQNIKVYHAVSDTVSMNVNMFKKSMLTELTLKDACRHHHGGGCS
jgi:predicted Fe-Mo cluster-binding NifX family protein